MADAGRAGCGRCGFFGCAKGREKGDLRGDVVAAFNSLEKGMSFIEDSYVFAQSVVEFDINSGGGLVATSYTG